MVRDSAGIVITETAEAIATSPIGWKVDSVPALSLGSEETPAETFYGVRGLRGLPGGGVLVVDAVSRELRFFDANGDLIKRVGRKGSGPGEFDSPYLVQNLRDDSLLVWDKGLKRFQHFSETGENPRTITLLERWPRGNNPPLGMIGSRLLVTQEEMSYPSRSLNTGFRPLMDEYFWMDLSTWDEVPVVTFRPQNRYILPRRFGLDRTQAVPFTKDPSATVSKTSAFITEGIQPEIREYGIDGALRRIFRVPGFRRPVTREMVEGFLDYTLTRTKIGRDELERRLDEVPTPDTLSAFQSLLVDEVGWLWAEIYHWDRTQQSGRWMIFDPEGHAKGIFTAPDGLQIKSIGEDFLLGVRFDEFDVEHVVRYGLERGEWDSAVATRG